MRHLFLYVTSVVVAISSFGACSDDADGSGGAGASGSNTAGAGQGGAGGGASGTGGSAPAPGEYGAECTTPDDCDSGVCGSFMMDALHLCTLECTSDDMCPNEDKCSGMGQCNPVAGGGMGMDGGM